jgi:polyphosphate glucokinase
MNILAIDVGGTHVKVLLSGETTPRKFESGPTLTAKKMVERVKEIADGWNYDAVSIDYPGPVLRNRPVLEPHNLGKGWVGLDYARAFGKPVKLINDVAMQALGTYKRGKMLFLRRQPSKTTSGFAAWKNAVKRNGVVMLPTSCSLL